METAIPTRTQPESDTDPRQLTLAVLKQFRLIYGSVRQHFREIEQVCGVSGSQLWLLHEISGEPGIGVSELARRLSIHQSTCSQLVDKLEARALVNKQRLQNDQRRVGLHITESALALLQRTPGPAEGLLPAIFFIFSRQGCDAAVGQQREQQVRCCCILGEAHGRIFGARGYPGAPFLPR